MASSPHLSHRLLGLAHYVVVQSGVKYCYVYTVESSSDVKSENPR